MKEKTSKLRLGVSEFLAMWRKRIEQVFLQTGVPSVCMEPVRGGPGRGEQKKWNQYKGGTQC